MHFICNTYLYKYTSYLNVVQMCKHTIRLTVYMCDAYETNISNKCASLLQQHKCYMHTSPYVLHMCDTVHIK